MSGMLGSQGLVLATAMVVSTTVLFIAFSRQKTFSENHDSREPADKTPRSCLSSGDKKKGEKKKKKVQFAENVKENQYKKKRSRMESEYCRDEIPGIQGMPANRAALYRGILKDRVQRIECSY
ncbi:uncharacterized protein LOC112091753 [Morus notabilis]|uniref:uncharacterized protein LOC112091753 n=1 Tax=Morus notabilis TaxID=981085 RepID=UPI000CED7940|nr:uncharacterized protein LOC112091753 [Morus notabilis]